MLKHRRERTAFAMHATALLLMVSIFWASAPAATAQSPPCHRMLVEGRTLCAALAITDEEVQRGLMGRRAIAADEGMLFIYERPRRMQFWMKDTLLALDIGYFDAAGILQEIHPLVPLDLTPVPSRSDRIRFALEVRRGWFADHGITVGARLDLALVDAALAARGVNLSVQ